MRRMRMGCGAGLAAFLVCATAGAVPGASVTYTAGENELTVTADDGSHAVQMDCSGKSTLVHKGTLYVACGDAGVLVFSLEDPLQPKLQKRIAVEGSALEVTATGDDIYVRTQTIALKPLKSAPRTTFAPWTAPTVLAAPCPTYEPPPKKPSKWPSIMAPPRQLGFSAGAELHGFISVGNSGGGIGTDLHATVRIPWASFHAHMWPLAMAFDGKGNQLAISAFGIAALDTEYFELGLGAGGMSFNVGPRSNSGFLLTILTRIGAVDGLNMTTYVELDAADRAISRGMLAEGPSWDFAGFRGIFAIPLGERLGMLLRGAGSLAGFGSGDLALRYRFRGEGGRNTVYGLVGFGGYGTFFGGSTLAGPSLSAGVEWRP
jgi:hypothetical protein